MQNRDGRKSLLIVIAFAMTSFWSLTCVAQDEKPWQFPVSLRPSLDDRVKVFMAAQAEGRWDQVELLLGDYYRTGSYLRYTPARKACLIMQLQAAPMIAFTFNVQESPFSSEILTTSPGRRWWTLVGEGTFRIGIDKVTRRASITAYQDGNNWYFTPGTYFDYEVWARTHLPAKKVATDPKDELDLQVPPDCPLEVVDLRVTLGEKDSSSRRIQFRLRNKSSQRVDGYFFEISDEREDGSISISAPEFIEPGAFSRKWDKNISVYSFWCEAEPRMRLKIEDVNLSDGTVWKASRRTVRGLPKYMTDIPQPIPPQIKLPDAPKTAREAKCFASFTTTSSMTDVVRKCGIPDEHQGSGIYIFLYDMADGSVVVIGTADLKKLMYVNQITDRGSHSLL